jgi:CheY-specific phosphatase CheX
MQTTTADVFRSVAENVLERFAFTLAEEDVDSSPDEAWRKRGCSYLHSSIAFSGPAEGVVNLTAPEELCRELAANVLGGEVSEMGRTQAEDALKELANVMCGELTERLYGEKAVFDLTVPSVCEIDGGKWRELTADANALRLKVETGVLLANLVLAGEE